MNPRMFSTEDKKEMLKRNQSELHIKVSLPANESPPVAPTPAFKM